MGAAHCHCKVYPRVCGGTHNSQSLMRITGQAGSIPRVCGGTHSYVHFFDVLKLNGLSPRVRGNHQLERIFPQH